MVGTSYISQVLNLFSTNEHKCSVERLNILLSWLELPNGCNKVPSHTTFEMRLQFLKTIWSKDYFRPFDHVRSAEYYLMANTHVGYLVRLSSQPGKITITKRNKDGAIYHSRYSILNGELCGSKGNKFESLEELCRATSCTTRYPTVAKYIKA